MIPKIMHQIWIGPHTMPEECMETWKKLNPELEYKLWTETTGYRYQGKIDKLIAEERYACAADIMRVEILEEHGGVFVDADSYALKPIQDAPFFLESSFFVGLDYDSFKGEYSDWVANGTIGSTPHNAILLDYLERIGQASEYWEYGGRMLTQCLAGRDATILPACCFTPKNWDGREAEIEGEIYARQLWGSTHGQHGLAVVTANLGEFDESPPGAITDKEFPPRINSMQPRLQARIVKTHMWQFVPDHQYYLWVDASCRLERGGKEWFMEQLGDGDVAVFRHNKRRTVQEEADFLKERLALEKAGKKQKYILPRYENEDIDGQLAEVDPSAQVYASTAFIFRNSMRARWAMKQWWYYISRYHSIDQLSLPWVIRNLDVRVIDEDYLNIPHLTYVRQK